MPYPLLSFEFPGKNVPLGKGSLTLGVLPAIYAIVFSGAGIKFYKLLTDYDQELSVIGVAASFYFMCVGIVTLTFHLLGDNEQPLQCGIDY